ncbi:MAG: SGNH/GDSL hydrolase family protein [Roseburia sp.]
MEESLIKKYGIETERSVANRGNLKRLKDCMKRAEAGEAITIGFIGGSITQGSLATSDQKCYAYHVYSWWKEKFPNAKMEYVNAGIGGTTSQFGVARAEEDLLQKKPDFVIVEFSVNDKSTEHFMETYEGLVRKVLNAESHPAVLLVHSVYYDSGANAQLMHARIGRYYDLPCISMQSSVFPQVVNGKIPNREITPDDLHPNDTGHRLEAEIIISFLEQVKEKLQVEENAYSVKEKALTQNAYENSVRFQRKNAMPVLAGFEEDKMPQEGITDRFKNGWIASKQGDSITFQVKGSCIGIQYRETIDYPAQVAEVILDGKKVGILDANFEETWGDNLELDTIAEHIEDTLHEVTIRLVEAPKEAKKPFYLVSVIASS